MERRDFKEYVRKELTHSPPTSEAQREAHQKVSLLFLDFAEELAEFVPDCPDATKMVNHLTISRAWAQKSVAQHFVADEAPTDG